MGQKVLVWGHER